MVHFPIKYHRNLIIGINIERVLMRSLIVF